MIFGRHQITGKINQYSSRRAPFVFAIDYKGDTGFVLSPEEAAAAGIRYHLEGKTAADPALSPMKLDFRFTPASFDDYRRAFDKVMFHLKRGDTYLLNLTFPTPVQCNLSPEEIYAASRAPYKLLVPGKFVVFSPEAFVRICGSRIITHPMKGTIDASIPGAEQKLLDDEKELFEHHTIVDLLRNDLSQVATGVRVDRFRYIDRIRTHRGEILQASSEISGELPGDWRDRLGQILFDLLPAGSVTGAPKERTVQIIGEVETFDRGFYTGIFGYSDGTDLTSAVTIRFIEQAKDGMVFRSGGGITVKSRAEDEYNELITKIYVPVV